MRVMVLEDEVLLALDISEILQELGHEVVGPVHDLAGAAALLEQGDIDLAVLDYNLSSGNSAELADRLLESGTSIAFLTAHDRAFLDRRFDGVPLLPKPFQPHDLAALLDATQARRAAR